MSAVRGQPPGSDSFFFFQTSHQEFSTLKQSNAESNQREEVLKKLASAHDSYVEISSNLREGTKVLAQHHSCLRAQTVSDTVLDIRMFVFWGFFCCIFFFSGRM